MSCRLHQNWMMNELTSCKHVSVRTAEFQGSSVTSPECGHLDLAFVIVPLLRLQIHTLVTFKISWWPTVPTAPSFYCRCTGRIHFSFLHALQFKFMQAFGLPCRAFLLDWPVEEVPWIYVTYQDLDAFLFHWRLVICSSTHSNQGVYSIRLKILHIKTHFLNTSLFLPLEIKWKKDMNELLECVVPL